MSFGSGHAVSVARLSLSTADVHREAPVWTEVDIAGMPHLYYADLQAQTLEEIPYPFPEGLGGHLVGVNTGTRDGVALIDTSASTHEILAAFLDPTNPLAITVTRARFATEGNILGVTIGPRAGAWDRVPAHYRDRRLLQFFDDTERFAVVDVRDTSGGVEIVEDEAGGWPYHVVDGDVWYETGANFPLHADLSDPSPFIVLTDDGSIFISHFEPASSIEGAPTPIPFGRVAAGTQTIAMWFQDPLDYWSVFAVEPDGTEVILSDSDDVDLASLALKPQRHHLLGPFTSSAKGNWDPRYSFSEFAMAIDDHVVQFLGPGVSQ